MVIILVEVALRGILAVDGDGSSKCARFSNEPPTMPCGRVPGAGPDDVLDDEAVSEKYVRINNILLNISHFCYSGIS